MRKGKGLRYLGKPKASPKKRGEDHKAPPKKMKPKKTPKRKKKEEVIPDDFMESPSPSGSDAVERRPICPNCKGRKKKVRMETVVTGDDEVNYKCPYCKSIYAISGDYDYVG